MQLQESTGHWQLWAALAAWMAALTAVLAKLGVGGLDAGLATFLRTVVVVVALGLLMAASGQLGLAALQSVPRASLLALGLSGLATALSWLFDVQALQLGPVARVASIDKFSVVLVALFGVLALGERLSALAWLGILVMGGGAVLVAIA
ncbi:MAG: EamA family transporter [Synechococcaceae cyanobacterium]|nr:EamA family transporter [Synechococcaceae cyanobacterium]